MVKEIHKVVKQYGERRIIIANTATSIDENNENDVVVDGSHFGINVGKMALNAKIRGMIGNDAGKGLDNAGIAGLKFLEKHDIPAAAVSCVSATIGDGTSTYEEGEISTVNEAAKRLGITIGMSAKEADTHDTAAAGMPKVSLLSASTHLILQKGSKPMTLKNLEILSMASVKRQW